MSPPNAPPGDRPLHEQLAYLQLLERAATAANEHSNLEDAARVVLAEVCEYTGWPVGHLYVSDGAGSELLVPSGVWYLADPERFATFRGITESYALAAGVGLPGRILASRRPAWIPDIRLDADFPRASHSEDIGVRAAFGFPVMVGQEVAAVLEFLAGEPVAPDERLLELMVSVGHQLARVVERSRATEAVLQSEQRYRALMQSARDGFISADGNGVIVSFNQGAERAFGWSEEEIVGHPLKVLMPERFRAMHESGLVRLVETGVPTLIGKTVELVGLRRDGQEFPLELSLSSWETLEGRFYTGIVRDITERKDAERTREAFERQLSQRALHDPLTQLPNRALLQDRLEQALARASRRGSSVAVLALDLDRFKAVNDSLGHQAGDELLVAVAERLREVLRPDDTLARIGGDEFALLVEDVANAAEALSFAERVGAAMSRPFPVLGELVMVTARVGTALAPGVLRNPDQPLRDAEVAMEYARDRTRGRFALYDESMRAEAAERSAVESALRRALREGQLRLHYQPIVELATSTLAGVEALVRWQHPVRGLLFPQQFIGLAEDTGLIIPLGHWVLEEACRQGAAWLDRLPAGSPMRISVNVSARQFQQPQWPDDVATVVKGSRLDPGQLVLEITESVLMDDTDHTTRRLAEMRDLGVRIAIDDFGTGYSSLGYLRHFPVDILKVDKSFIDGVAEGPHDSALARAVIKLAATLNLDAVAEGVGTRRQVGALRRLRCRYAQGYYFSRPQPAEAIDALLDKPEPFGDLRNGAPYELLERQGE